MTEEAITSGLAPGYCAVTWIVGKSTGGNAEMGKSMYPSNPISTTPAISSEVATGRWMKGSEMFTEVSRQDSGPAEAAGLADEAGFTCEPICKRYWPSTTILSLALSPLSIKASPFSIWATFTGRTSTD